MKYLRDNQYYDDLYDLATIKQCINNQEWLQARELPPFQGKKFIDEKSMKSFLTDISLYFIKGERYRNKSGQIREWQELDKQRDDAYENAIEPNNIICRDCGVLMQMIDKDLYDFSSESLRVLFFFSCSVCKKRRAVFNDGEEFKSRPELCPKCMTALEVNAKFGIYITTWTKICRNCDYRGIDIDDHAQWRKNHEQEQREDALLLKKFRIQFCLSDQKGQEYVASTDATRRFVEHMEEDKCQKADIAYQKMLQLKRLSVTELEKTLNKIINKRQYVKLNFEKPEIGKYVIIPFTVQDADSSRTEYDSADTLKKLIKNVLDDTNWRLMSGGLIYRLGYISGRLKGYEQIEDLINIVRSKRKIS